MRHIFNLKRTVILVCLAAFVLTGCNDYLDREPLASVSPGDYLWTESHLQAYSINMYDEFSTPISGSYNIGNFSADDNTDNQVTTTYDSRWAPGDWRTPQSGGWIFTSIRNCNYFLQTVLPRWKKNEIKGTPANISHYIGEIYFMRAYLYFQKVQAFGDFPIVRNTLIDDMGVLIDASKRRPRNEVARFIISDLDSAAMLLSATSPNGTNRISKNVAQLFKSRVALHEASWLTYHKGTAMVPKGPGWPGEGRVDNYSINIDEEIKYFLDEAMNSAEIVADAVTLTNNTKNDGYNSSANPYYTMFCSDDLSSYKEVLLWRQYNLSQSTVHNVNHYLNSNGANTGFTRGFVDNFLMANGLPIYADGSGYQGDDYIADIKKNRDNRLVQFVKCPGELRFTDIKQSDGSPYLRDYPFILDDAETRDVTGYAVKKGMSYLSTQREKMAGTTGMIVFRAVEAYLNYIEASYMKTGTINAKADQYWRAIRNRAGVDPDYNKTIAATDMTQEAKNDFAAYSVGLLLSDKTLYNIRRERRCELIAEGFRYADLKRWRALDQLKTNPYIVEGFKLWGPMQDWYKNSNGTSKLIEAETAGKTANVSKKSESPYLRPYRIFLTGTNLVKDGYKWTQAHYLQPIAISHFLITASDPNDLTTSSIYQNPGWPLTANTGALDH